MPAGDSDAFSVPSDLSPIISDDHVEHRYQQHPQRGGDKHATGYAGADGVPAVGAGAGGQRQGHDTEDERDGGHQHRVGSAGGMLP